MGYSGICAELALCSPDSQASSSLTFFPLRSSKFLISFCMILQRWQWQIFIIIRWQNTTKCYNQVQSFFFQNISEGHATFIWQRRLLLGQVSTKYSPLIVKLLHKVHQLAVFQEVTLACSLINVTIIKSHQQCYCWCGILYILLLLLWTFLFTFKSCSRSFYTSLRDLNTSSVTKNEWCSSYFDCVQKVSCTNLQRLFVQSTHCSFRSDRLSLFCQSWDFSAMQKKYFSTGERRHFRNIFGIKQLNYSGEREKQHCRSWLIEEISSYGFKHLGCRLCI